MPVPGQAGVVGSTLRWCDASGVVRYYTGSAIGQPAGARKGSVWVEGTSIHYIDESGYERVLPYLSLSTVQAKQGSAWIEGAYPHYLDGTGPPPTERYVCDSACMYACQGCNASCESACLVGCLACEPCVACEGTCETACEAACQTACLESCEPGAEVCVGDIWAY